MVPLEMESRRHWTNRNRLQSRTLGDVWRPVSMAQCSKEYIIDMVMRLLDQSKQRTNDDWGTYATHTYWDIGGKITEEGRDVDNVKLWWSYQPKTITTKVWVTHGRYNADASWSFKVAWQSCGLVGLNLNRYHHMTNWRGSLWNNFKMHTVQSKDAKPPSNVYQRSGATLKDFMKTIQWCRNWGEQPMVIIRGLRSMPFWEVRIMQRKAGMKENATLKHVLKKCTSPWRIGLHVKILDRYRWYCV